MSIKLKQLPSHQALPRVLPPLASADFDFKTGGVRKGGLVHKSF